MLNCDDEHTFDFIASDLKSFLRLFSFFIVFQDLLKKSKMKFQFLLL